MKTRMKKIASFLIVGTQIVNTCFTNSAYAMITNGETTQPENNSQVTEENSSNSINQEPQFLELGDDVVISSCDTEGDVTIPEEYQNNSNTLVVDCDVKNLNLENSCFTLIMTLDNHTIKNITFSENNKTYKLSSQGSDILNKDSGKLIFSNSWNVSINSSKNSINNEPQFYEMDNNIVISSCDAEGNVTIPEEYQNNSNALVVDCDVKNLNLENSCFTLIMSSDNHTIKNITFSENNKVYTLSPQGSDIVNKDSGKIIFSNPGNVSINSGKNSINNEPQFYEMDNDIVIFSCDDEGNVTIPEKYQNNSNRLIVDCDVENLNLGNSCFNRIMTLDNHTIKNITFSENNESYKLRSIGSHIVNKDSGEFIFLNPGNVSINSGKNSINNEPQFYEMDNNIVISSCDAEGNLTIPEKYQNNSNALVVNCDVKNLNLENSCFTFIMSSNNHTIKNITFSENNKTYKLSSIGSDIVNKDSGKIIFSNPGNVSINNEPQIYELGNNIVISSCDPEGNVTIPKEYQNNSTILFVKCDVENLNLENSCFTLIVASKNHTIKNITFSENNKAKLIPSGSDIANSKFIYIIPGNVLTNNKGTIYTQHDKKFIDLLPTDEQGLKHYVNIKIDKYSDPNDKKNYKNLSKEDYLMIKREVVFILNEKFETGLNREEIMEASDEQCDIFLQNFNAYKKRDKARAIYDWITKNIKYDKTQIKEKNHYIKNFAAQTFKDRKGVCQGFAQLSKLMMRLSGVPCLETSGIMHAFNYIYIEDSESNQLDWILMDAASGCRQIIDFIDEKDPSKGTEIKSNENNNNFLLNSKSESIDLVNKIIHYSIKQFNLFPQEITGNSCENSNK